MSLIFDRFKTKEDAEKFAASIRKKYKRKASVYESQAASQGKSGGNPRGPKEDDAEEHDYFPFVLQPPIVLVERVYNGAEKPGTEEQIEETVEKFGGVFAGT